MSINWFRTFIAVSRHRSFAAAAQQIGLTPAAVSIQMSALEEHLHIKLFDRSARTAILNTRGRELVPRAQELINLYDNMGSAASERQLGGTLALGAIPPSFAQLLPDALLRLRRAHPGIAVRVSNGVSSELMRRVEQGELDAAIVSEAPFRFASNLSWQTVASEPLVLVTPAGVKTQGLAAILAAYPFIGVTRSSWTGQLTHSLFRRHHLKINEVMELDSLEAIAAMVARGFGVSILPLSAYIRGLGKQVRIALLSEPQSARDIGLIYRHGQSDPALVSALCESLLAAPKDPPVRLRRIAMHS